MNREDIIRMAEEAGLVRFEGGELEAYGIAKASLDDHSLAFWSIADEQRLKRFAALIAEAEREACLAACRIYLDDDEPYPGFQNGVACCIGAIENHEEFLAHMKKKGMA
jgi:hypothetical protein